MSVTVGPKTPVYPSDASVSPHLTLEDRASRRDGVEAFVQTAPTSQECRAPTARATGSP